MTIGDSPYAQRSRPDDTEPRFVPGGQLTLESIDFSPYGVNVSFYISYSDGYVQSLFHMKSSVIISETNEPDFAHHMARFRDVLDRAVKEGIEIPDIRVLYGWNHPQKPVYYHDRHQLHMTWYLPSLDTDGSYELSIAGLEFIEEAIEEFWLDARVLIAKRLTTAVGELRLDILHESDIIAQ